MIFNQDKLYKNVIGVFFGGKKLQVARIENGSVAQIIHKEINNKESEEYILNELILAIETVFNDTIRGIGIGVPSIVDVKNGIVFKATNVPSWRKVYLKDIIEERFNIPTYVNNDANCFAMGEKYFGVAKDFRNIAGVTIGAGLGVGIIINGRLYSGKNCGAGEFCSIPYRDHDYEYYCSIGYFEEKYGIKSNILFGRAKKKDKIALSIYEQFGLDLGNAIKTIIYAIDPEAIVIGGQLAEAYEFFQETMFKNIKTFLYQNTINNIVVLKSEEPNIEAYGAAALCFENDLSFI
jgi:glucokinase